MISKSRSLRALFTVSALIIFAPPCAFAEDRKEPAPERLPVIRIVADPAPEPWTQTVRPLELEQSTPADGGEVLRNVPGVDGVRMGGHGIDPVIRGQGQERVNLLLDGARIYGGCPNRMDPASSYASPLSYDQIRVIKGSQTVVYGGGGTAGTVLFERKPPHFEEGQYAQGQSTASYTGNGKRRGASFEAAGGLDNHFLRTHGSYLGARDYEDGDGNKVRSGFRVRDLGVSLGLSPNEDSLLDFRGDISDGDDILFAGAGMDAPNSDSQVYSTGLRWEPPGSSLTEVKSELYYSNVDHLMDNFSLRPKAEGMPFLSADSDTSVLGGRVIVSGESGPLGWILGTDFEDAAWDATRFSGQDRNVVTRPQSFLWPDIDLTRWGLFSEGGYEIASHTRMVLGIRYDYIDVSADDTDREPAGMALSANELYELYYGNREKDITEDHVGGLIRLEHQLLEKKAFFYLTFSRSLRTADPTERFMASNAMSPERRWVGNPMLDPERQHQLEASIAWTKMPIALNVSVYHNWIDDYILRDRARSQQGILQDDRATIYRNISARFWGGEIDAQCKITDSWSARASLDYVHATNSTDSRPVAQIPPLHSVVQTEYGRDWWRLGTRLRMATKQTRVDDDPNTGSGLDAGQTPGYTVLDLYASVSPVEYLTLEAGIDNIFDHTYAEHLNKTNAFNVDQVQVNEPGLSAWVRLKATL